MKRPSAAAAVFAVLLALGAGAASADPILYTFTGLRGGAGDTCKWFNDNLTDPSIAALSRQTDLLYNRIALPVDENVTVGVRRRPNRASSSSISISTGPYLHDRRGGLRTDADSVRRSDPDGRPHLAPAHRPGSPDR